MRLSALKDLTRFEQTLFGLPFIFSALCLVWAAPYCAKYIVAWVLVFPAFLLARVSGMAFNQLIDRHIDAKNPRTQHRVLPAGKITPIQARLVAWGSLLLFVIICFLINKLTALLAPLAAILLFVYSYMKRVHPSCHLVLGLIHFLGPVMTYASLMGTVSMASIWLGSAAAFSIIGIDVAYAMQDFEFDRSQGLFSIPSRFGLKKGLIVSAVSHALCLFSLVMVGISASFPTIYYFVLPFMAWVFFSFHKLLWKEFLAKGKITHLEPAFFKCSVSASLLSLAFILLGALWVAIL